MPNFKSFFPKVLDPLCQISSPFSLSYLTRIPNFKSFFPKVLGPVCQISSPFFPRYLTSIPNFKSFFPKVLDQYARFQVLFSQGTWPTMPNFKSFSPKELAQYAKFRVLFLEFFFSQVISPVCRISTYFFKTLFLFPMLLNQYAEFQVMFLEPLIHPALRSVTSTIPNSKGDPLRTSFLRLNLYNQHYLLYQDAAEVTPPTEHIIWYVLRLTIN